MLSIRYCSRKPPSKNGNHPAGGGSIRGAKMELKVRHKSLRFFSWQPKYESTECVSPNLPRSLSYKIGLSFILLLQRRSISPNSCCWGDEVQKLPFKAP